jgi:putative hydrolase of the HAD superfamily
MSSFPQFHESPHLVSSLTSVLRKYTKPLEPLITVVKPDLSPLPGIKAVIFDIYGTLFISQSGDIGTAEEGGREELFTQAFQEADIVFNDLSGIFDLYVKTINQSHRECKELGIDSPEVNILEIWQKICTRLLQRGSLCSLPGEQELVLLAQSYEVLSNNVWPMPGISEMLENLQSRELLLGIVSNAQFYTPLLFRFFLNKLPEDLGFVSDLCVYSFQHGRSKPSPKLFLPLTKELAERGIDPDETLYIGNDMLNDIWTAAHAGLKTCLFAGDLRSLRLREEDERCNSTTPDRIIIRLSQLEEILIV